ncbi:MAG: hypothetical protein BMS9Abin23_1152 [Thermodesulfobacteriota bacterium]|nr:MAG: hypothetical protein BMS9Abin23_1152 [Thermodesulfobacteriota bacterium]
MAHTPKGFKKTLIGSLVFHVILLSALLFYRTGTKKIFFAPVYTVSLMEPSGAPSRKPGGKKTTKTKKTPKKTVKKAAKKTVVTKKKIRPKVSTTKKVSKTKKTAKKAVKVKQKSKASEDAVSIAAALKNIKEKVREKERNELVASRVDEIRKKRESQRLAPDIEEIKKGLADGGGGSSGTSGLKPGEFEVKHKAYFVIIRDRVQENWVYPEGFNRQSASVIVSIRIGRKGDLLDIWVEKGSGNRQFDLSLLDAVRKSAPFPPLPVDFEGDFLETGLRFCPQCTGN